MVRVVARRRMSAQSEAIGAGGAAPLVPGRALPVLSGSGIGFCCGAAGPVSNSAALPARSPVRNRFRPLLSEGIAVEF